MRAACAVFLVAACGSRERTQDAGDLPPPPDTLAPQTADAPAGAVTVAVTLDGAAVPNAPVYFQNADSQVVASLLTDGNGTAGAVLAAGGFVTVIEPPSGNGRTDISTFAAVEPGDALRLDLAPRASEVQRTFDATINADPSADVLAHFVVAPCGMAAIAAGAPQAITLTGCPAITDLMVVSADQFGTVLNSHYHPAQDLTAAALDLTGTYEAPGTTSFAYTAVPGPVSFVAMNHALVTPMGTIFNVGDGIAPTAGAANMSLRLPQTQGTTAVTATSVFTTIDDPGEQLVIEWAPAGGGYALQIGGALLSAYTSPAAYDVAAHAIAWTEASGGAQPDVVRASILATRPDIPEGRTWRWRMIAPRAGTSVAFPTLPDDGFDFNVAGGDTVGVSELTTAKLPAGYGRAVRERGFESFKRLVTGASGRLVQQSLHDPTPVDRRQGIFSGRRDRSGRPYIAPP